MMLPNDVKIGVMQQRIDKLEEQIKELKKMMNVLLEELEQREEDDSWYIYFRLGVMVITWSW